MALLEVNDLKTYFRTDDGIVKAVDGVSFQVEKGKTLGIVGESGSGKSVTCLTIMGLNAKKNTITSGEALFKGEDLITMPSKRLRDIRGNDIAMIFQDPMTSLNPVHTIGKQLVEAIQLHRDVSKRQAKARALELLKAVGHPARRPADRRLPAPVLGRHAPARDDRDGARQRPRPADRRRADDGARRDHAGADPGADGPAPAGVRQRDHHDHARPRRDRRDRRRGRRHVRRARGREGHRSTGSSSGPIIRTPGACSGSLPRLDADTERLVQIQGQPPSLLNPPRGCRFNPRCPYVMSICKQEEPELRPVGGEPDHLQACHLDEETKDREAAKLLAGTLAEAS